jgi:DNA-binding response OmpR family regulator
LEPDKKHIDRMAPMLHRIVIGDPQSAQARVIGQMMRDMMRSEIQIATSPEQVMDLASEKDPQLLFLEKTDRFDGVGLTRKLRRSSLSCRKAPVILTTATATAAGILQARDAGVHEFLLKPFTIKDLLRRLEAVTLRQRDWIEAVNYVGPDRRRFNSGDYTGPLKRRSDRQTPERQRVTQAIKILKSSLSAFDSDPDQAIRSIEAQLADIFQAAQAAGESRLASTAQQLAMHIMRAKASGQRMSGKDLEQKAEAVLAYAPKETGDR